MNRYSYVVNDPVNFLDPDGHEEESVFSSNNDLENIDSDDSLQYVLDTPIDDYSTWGTSYNSQMNDGYDLNDPVNTKNMPWWEPSQYTGGFITSYGAGMSDEEFVAERARTRMAISIGDIAMQGKNPLTLAMDIGAFAATWIDIY